MGRLKPGIRGNPVCHGSRVFPKEQGNSQWSSLSTHCPETEHSGDLLLNRVRVVLGVSINQIRQQHTGTLQQCKHTVYTDNINLLYPYSFYP